MGCRHLYGLSSGINQPGKIRNWDTYQPTILKELHDKDNHITIDYNPFSWTEALSVR